MTLNMMTKQSAHSIDQDIDQDIDQGIEQNIEKNIEQDVDNNSGQNIKQNIEQNIEQRKKVLHTLKQGLIERLNLYQTAEQIDDDTPLFGNGLKLDSVDATEVIVLLDEAFAIRVHEGDDPAYMRSINTLASFVISKQAESRNSARYSSHNSVQDSAQDSAINVTADSAANSAIDSHANNTPA